MHAFVQHPHRQRAGGDAAQRGGQPELVVVAAAGIEADDQRRIADAVDQVVDVVGQVVAAGFLAGLDQDDAARVRHVLLAAAPAARRGAKHRVAVVGAAAAVELVVLAHRHPRADALGPAGHLRLLVEMAVEQHGVVVGVARHLDEDQRRAAGQAHDLERGAREGRRAAARAQPSISFTASSM